MCTERDPSCKQAYFRVSHTVHMNCMLSQIKAFPYFPNDSHAVVMLQAHLKHASMPYLGTKFKETSELQVTCKRFLELCPGLKRVDCLDLGSHPPRQRDLAGLAGRKDDAGRG